MQLIVKFKGPNAKALGVVARFIDTLEVPPGIERVSAKLKGEKHEGCVVRPINMDGFREGRQA